MKRKIFMGIFLILILVAKKLRAFKYTKIKYILVFLLIALIVREKLIIFIILSKIKKGLLILKDCDIILLAFLKNTLMDLNV